MDWIRCQQAKFDRSKRSNRVDVIVANLLGLGPKHIPLVSYVYHSLSVIFSLPNASTIFRSHL